MSDSGRPQFLPPEEPPEEPPPGVPVPPGPSRQSGPALVVVLVAVVVLLLVGGGVLLYQSSGDASSAAGPTASPTAPPGSEAPAYAKVPDPCQAIGKALPADVRSVKPRRSSGRCDWELLRQDRSRSLDVEFQLEQPQPWAGISGTAAAAKAFAGDFAYSADGSQNGGFERAPERFGGLGDEAFAAQAFTLIIAGPTEKTATSYDMGGADVEVRKRNVVLTVKWRGADYPPAVRGHKKLVGRNFAYPEAKQQAVAVARALLAELG